MSSWTRLRAGRFALPAGLDASRQLATGALLAAATVVGAASPLACAPTPPGAEPRTAEKAETHALTSSSSGTTSPKLVLWVTIDQFRGDYLERFEERLSSGGLKRLLREGLHFTHASFRHSITETAPGHATLFTGTAPRQHGIIGNSWLLPSGRSIESVVDASSPLLGLKLSDKAHAKGRSPRSLRVGTIGDALRRQTYGKAKVYGVSIKDRAAILPAGHAGKAFWYSEGSFVTSRYYYDELPEWFATWSKAHSPDTHIEHEWPLLLEEQHYEGPPKVVSRAPTFFGEVFPHRIDKKVDLDSRMKLTPFGDLATLHMAQAVLEANELGKDDVVDLLSVSLSCTDTIGHFFGPESREFEDHVLRLDRELSDFFAKVDERIGWRNVLVVLTADHGALESQDHLEALGIDGAQLTEAAILQVAKKAAIEKFTSDAIVLGVESPYVYLDREAIAAHGKDLMAVRRHLAKRIAEMPLVYGSHPVGDAIGSSSYAAAVQASIDPARAGDIYVTPRPYAAFLQGESLVATHGSPWSYDSHVPIVLVGAGIPQGQVHRSADVRSLAGTVAALLGITAPPSAKRELLIEALR